MGARHDALQSIHNGCCDTQTYTPTNWAALMLWHRALSSDLPEQVRQAAKEEPSEARHVHPATKTPIYAFNWKGEAARPPPTKSLGPMALELPPRRVPGSVMKHPRTGSSTSIRRARRDGAAHGGHAWRNGCRRASAFEPDPTSAARSSADHSRSTRQWLIGWEPLASDDQAARK